jgi:putative MATE family efflux protein
MKNQHKNIDELEFGNIKKVLWKFFLPSFAGVMINSLYNIVDRIFIGQGVGPIGLSALSAVFPIMLIIMGFGMLVGIGAGVRVSINLGLKNIAQAEKVLGNAIILLIIISLFITATGFLIKGPMLRLFGVSQETYGYANEYLNIILFGTMFGMMGFALNNIIRSEGNARIAMYSMLISAGLNIILDPIFIFALNMGVKGAAWATIIAQSALLFWVLLHFRGKNSVIRLNVSNFKLKGKIIWYIFSIGFAPFSIQIAASMVQGMINTQLVKYGGDIAVGAMGIINSYAMLIIMSVIAINMASQPLIGFNYGAKNFERVKKTFILCLKAGTYISITGFIIAQLFPHFIVKAFNKESIDLLEIGVQGLRIFFSAFGIVGFQIITSNYFQSTGKVGYAIFLSLLRQVLVLIPVLWILPRYLQLKGVWFAIPISDIASGIICAIVLIREIRVINKSIEVSS